MKIRASILTITAGAILAISGLGVGAQTITSAPANHGSTLAALTDTAATHAVTPNDGGDPWPKPGP